MAARKYFARSFVPIIAAFKRVVRFNRAEWAVRGFIGQYRSCSLEILETLSTLFSLNHSVVVSIFSFNVQPSLRSMNRYLANLADWCLKKEVIIKSIQLETYFTTIEISHGDIFEKYNLSLVPAIWCFINVSIMGFLVPQLISYRLETSGKILSYLL